MADVPANEQQDENEGRLDRRSVLKYGGTGAAAAGLAGCQSRENPLSFGAFRPPENDGGPDVDVDGDGPLSDETISIGVLAPMNLPLGESMWMAAQMARDDLNADGGILGAGIDVELGDTEVSPGTAQSEHRRLTTQENCDMTTGVFLGSALLQTMPSIANQEKLHVTTASADPRVGEIVSSSSAYQSGTTAEEEYERFKYHFRAGPIHLLDLADAMIEFVEAKKDDLGWERAAVLTENLGEFSPYHERLAANLDEVIDVQLTERPGGVSDWSPLFNEIEGEDCDIALIGMALIGTTAVNQWAQQERDFEFGGIHVYAQAFNYWESTNGNVEHVWTMNAMTPQTENTEQTQPFVQGFQEQFGEVPIYTAPLTYDAIMTLEEVLEQMHEDADDGLDSMPHADDIIPYLEDITVTDSSVLPEVQFTPPDAQYAHEPQWTSIEETGVPVFQQWQHDPEVREDYGTMHSFYPPQNKTSDYTVPDWVSD